MNNTMSEYTSSVNLSIKQSIMFLTILIVSAMIFRMYYFSSEVPVTLDAMNYFMYSYDIHVNGELPSNYTVAHNGWPIFLSMFFGFFSFDSALQYMQLQKIISISVSALTVIPVYYLCRKFFPSSYSLIGASFFAFEPRIIENSLIGISDPLFIITITISLCLFLSQNRILVICSFATIACATLIRPEGLFLFFSLTIMFFIKNRNRTAIIDYIIILSVFLLIILPMSAYRIETTNSDHLFIRVAESINEVNSLDSEEKNFILTGIENFIKYLGWDLIPIYIGFVPIGFVLAIKKLNFFSKTILVSMASMSIPIFYAYSIPIPETRYFYFIYPIFSILALFAIQKFSIKTGREKMIMVFVIIFIISTSIVFLELKLMNPQHDNEISLIMKDISKEQKIMNSLYPETTYLEGYEFDSRWNEITNFMQSDEKKTMIIGLDGKELREIIPRKIKLLPLEDMSSVSEYIQKYENKGLTHIIVDEFSYRAEFMTKIYQNEQDYDYLIKEYDSKDHGYSYEVKLFRIDYEKFHNEVIVK